MSISYGELAAISAMTDKELSDSYKDLAQKTEDEQDTASAILTEMEERGLPHP